MRKIYRRISRSIYTSHNIKLPTDAKADSKKLSDGIIRKSWSSRYKRRLKQLNENSNGE